MTTPISQYKTQRNQQLVRMFRELRKPKPRPKDPKYLKILKDSLTGTPRTKQECIGKICEKFHVSVNTVWEVLAAAGEVGRKGER